MLPVVVALLLVIAHADPEPVEIPLSEVWAHNLEGTKPIAGNSRQKGLILQEQLDRLSRNMSKTVHAGPAFVVHGDPRQAIKIAMAVIDGQIQPKHSLTEGDLCIVICAYGAGGSQFQLDKVEQGGHRIKVTWHFRHTGDEAVFWQFVMIPLVACEPGDYDVEINRTGEPKFGPDWWVSKSTSFQVLEREKPVRRIPGFAPNFSEKGTQ